MHAELEALICSGPRRGKQQTYMSVDARVPPTPALDREEALAELLSATSAAAGPATVKDFTTWSGLTVADAKAGLALIGDELRLRGRRRGTAWWSAPDAPAAPASTGAHLIPMYDELTIAYRQAARRPREQPPRNGLLERPILVDGATIGSWKRTLTARTVTVEATLFTEPDAAGQAARRGRGRALRAVPGALGGAGRDEGGRRMSDWMILVVGLALLGLMWSDRKNVRQAWKEPARWWRPRENFDAQAPSQPFNFVLGCVLGVAAVVFGILGLVT